MKLRFLGTASSIPNAFEDSPCYLINESILFDCGYNSLATLKELGCDLTKIKTVVFSHMHHDHYLGLAQFLFNVIHARPFPLDELTVFGPKEDVERVVGRCFDFLQTDIFYKEIKKPKIFPLYGESEFNVGAISVKTRPSRHPVPALMYRITDENGVSLALGGDGTYLPETNGFYENCDALVHDSTLGANKLFDNPHTRACGHSTLYEAIECAKNASIPVLFPVHMNSESASASITKANETSIKVINAKRGDEYEITKQGVLNA